MGYTQDQLYAITDQMKGQPRKTLRRSSPLEVYSAWLARLQMQPDAINKLAPSVPLDVESARGKRTVIAPLFYSKLPVFEK